MISISRAGFITSGIGSMRLYVRDSPHLTVDLGAMGGSAGFIADDMVAALVDGAVKRGSTWNRINGVWVPDTDLFSGQAANSLYTCLGGWLASDQPNTGHEHWRVWGELPHEPHFEMFGAICVGMSEDGAYAISGIATQWQVRLTWPDGTIAAIFPPGTNVRLSLGFCVYRLPNEKKIRLLSHTGEVSIVTLAAENYPGPVFVDEVGVPWLWYTTTDGRHLCHPCNSAAKGFAWLGGNQFGQGCRAWLGVETTVTFGWATGQGEDASVLVVETKRLADAAPLPSPPVDPGEPPMPALPTEAQQRAMSDALKKYREMFPATITGAQCGWILNAGCWERRADGWRLSAKTGEVTTPAGVQVSYDAFHHISDTIWDFATAEFHTMRILDMPIQQPHHNDPNRPPVEAVPPGPPPGLEPPGPVDPPPPGEFNKDIVKEETITAAAQLVVSVTPGISLEEATQGCREHFDRFPADWLPSVPEVADGAWIRSVAQAPVEVIDQFMPAAIAETYRLRTKAGYACRPVIVPPVPPSLERIRVRDLAFETVTGKPWRWIGATGFDLPFMIVKRLDPRFADFLRDTGFNLVRIVPATVNRNPRTLKEGRDWLRPTLDALKARGLYAEVTILVDTGFTPPNYGMNADMMRAYVADIGAICGEYPNTLVELANENGHAGNQNVELLTNAGFLSELRALVPAHVMVSHGSHGGDQPQIDQGNYVTWHADRGRSPEDNAVTMADRQRTVLRPVSDDEPLGIAEVASSSRTNDPEYGARLGRSDRAKGVAASTLHLEAGLWADVAKLGPIQRDAATRFVRERSGF